MDKLSYALGLSMGHNFLVSGRINRPEKNFWQRMPSVPVWWYFPAVCNMKCLPREKVVSRKLPIKFNVIIMEL